MSQPNDQQPPEQIDPLKIATELLWLKPTGEGWPQHYNAQEAQRREKIMRLGAIAIRQLVDENAKLRKELGKP